MWSKRVCGLILAAVMLFSSVPVAVHAEESPIEGYITVMAEGSSENYVCLKSNDTLFLSAEDLATISGYELSIGDHVAFSKAGGMDSVTAVDIQNDGTVSAMGKAYQLTVLNYQEKVYLPIANTLYLLHAQWSMEDGKLVVQPLPKTIIDFLGENNDAMWENKINQTDLLINGESELANILRSSLAAVFNDFDPMIFIFWWPGEGFTPALNDEFEEALLQIAVDDMDFLDTYGQQEISEMLQGSGFSQVKTSWGNIQSMLNLPDNLNLKDAVNKISEAADTNKSIKFNTYADISAIPLDQLEEWSNKMQPVTDVLTLLDYAIQVSEVATRSQQWGQDFLDQISVLTEFDDTGYNKMISDRVQLVANNLIKEYQDPIKSAVLEANEQAIALLLSEIWDVAPFGKFFALFNTGLAIAKTDKDIKTSIDAADLSYMVDCLVKTEHIAMTEMNRSYMDLIESRRTGSFTEEDLFRLRNCVMLSLRTNMRNTAFLYYLNEQLTDDPIWESSAQARSLRQQIINDCALVCQLMETESYDRLLLLDSDFGNIYSDEYGEVRTEITADIFTEGKMSTSLSENELLAITQDTSGEIIEEYIFVDMDHDTNKELIGAVANNDGTYQIWYCSSDGENCDKVYQTNQEYMDFCSLSAIHLDSETHVVLNTSRSLGTKEYYSIFKLKEQQIQVLISDNYGRVHQNGEDILLYVEGYGSSYDPSINSYTGRISNITYLYYGGDSYNEYGAHQLSEADFLKYENSVNIKEQIYQKEFTENTKKIEYSYFIRSNGILHIQCAVYQNDGFINYVHYTVKYTDAGLSNSLDIRSGGQIKSHLSTLNVTY